MRQPVFGQGINPAYGRADFSGFERGAAAMGSGMAMGLASLGAGFERGRAEKQAMEKQVRQAEATLQALGKRENLDSSLQELVRSYQDQLGDPNLSRREAAAIAETVNQSIDRTIQLGVAEMQKERQAEESQMRQLQIANQERQMRQAEQEQTGMEELLNAVRQNQQGIGRFVNTPAYQDQLDTLGQNPAIQVAAEFGLSPQTAASLMPQPSGNELAFVTDPESGQRIVTFGNTIQQINAQSAEQERTKFERELDAVDRSRIAAGIPALTPDQRRKAYQIYVTRQAQGTPNENLMQQLMNELMSRRYPDLKFQETDMFGGEPLPVESAPTETAPIPVPSPTPEEARERVNKRLFGR